ncbi:MAG TPA: Mpo1-like protein [Cytophagales bacterium]|nr:Mpo1-like protein [Cytophagales bacterium]
MRKIDLLLAEYGTSHKNETNKAIHWICVPLIFFSIIGLLWSIPSDYFRDFFSEPVGEFVNWGTIGLLIALTYYISLSVPLFFGMLLFSMILVAINFWISQNAEMPLWVICLVIFVIAWIGQFWGHKIEGKKPSFFKDLQFLLIGPAWLMHFIFNKLGIKY